MSINPLLSRASRPRPQPPVFVERICQRFLILETVPGPPSDDRAAKPIAHAGPCGAVVPGLSEDLADALILAGSNPGELLAALRTSDAAAGRTVPLLLPVLSAALPHDAFYDTVERLVSLGADGLVLTDCAGGADGERLIAALRVAEARTGLVEGRLGFLMISDGIAPMRGLGRCRPRLQGVALEPSALAAAFGAGSLALEAPALPVARARLQLAAIEAGAATLAMLTNGDGDGDTGLSAGHGAMTQGYQGVITDDAGLLQNFASHFAQHRAR